MGKNRLLYASIRNFVPLGKVKSELINQLNRLRKGKLTDINCSVEAALRDVNQHHTSLNSSKEMVSMNQGCYNQLGQSEHKQKFEVTL